jgi:hypothetical protein
VESLNLGLLSLCALLKFIAAFLIASIRLIGSSKIHLKAVIPRKNRGVNTGGAMYFRMPVAAAAVPVASGGGKGVVSSVDAPLWLLVLAPEAAGGGVMEVLLSNSLSSVASLHAQILASEGTNTSFEVTAFSESMTIGKALAPWLMRPTTVVVGLVQVPPNFLQLWMNLIFFYSTTSMMLSGSSVMVLILSIFEFFIVMAAMKASKFLLAVLVLFVV